MSKLVNKINGCQVKIEKLISLHRKLLTQHMELKKENEELLRKEDVLKATINSLEEKIEIIKHAKSLSLMDVDSQKTKLKINELVREIDKCISLLNR